jgi:hypothetical protein
MSLTIEQGIIMSYSDKAQRLVNVMQIPEHYVLANVRLPQVLKDQTLPAIGSLVIMARVDSFRSYIINVIRESKEFIDDDGSLRASTEDSVQALQYGEVYMESFGDPTSDVPGTGASFYMGNAGTITLTSGQTGEYITVGGSDTDDDHEIIINGGNVFLQGSPTALNISSICQFDNLNNIQIGNNFLIEPTLTEQPICELTMDAVGSVVLRNTNAGVTKAQLNLDVTGEVTLENLAANFSMDPVGNVSLSANTNLDVSSTGAMDISSSSTLDMSATGAMTVSGSTVNINNGTFGAARLNDLTLSNASTDPAWWLWWSLLSTQIAALPTVPLDGGATLKAGLAALFATIPTQIVGKINSASGTVKVGN